MVSLPSPQFHLNQGLLAAIGFVERWCLTRAIAKQLKATFDKIDAIAKSNFITVGQRNVQGKAVTEWQTRYNGFIGTCWLDEDTVLWLLVVP